MASEAMNEENNTRKNDNEIDKNNEDIKLDDVSENHINQNIVEDEINFHSFPDKDCIIIPTYPDELLLDNYQEPLLLSLVSECYNGTKKNGLLHGYCEVTFKGGHVFKGYFYEGKMHGEGYYKWADGICYQGDFFMNCIQGSGKYIWTDNSIYIGEVVNGLRNGYGEFFFANNIYSYKGDWLYGHIHGKGKLSYDTEDLSYYDGDWVEGKREGNGFCRFSSGDWYKGEWREDIQHGHGKMFWVLNNVIYEGDWKHGKQDGVGTYTWLKPRIPMSQYTTRNCYHGDINGNKRDGFGTFEYAGGASYEGCWKDNLKHGKGKYTFKNGRVFEGHFFEDKIIQETIINSEMNCSQSNNDMNRCQANNATNDCYGYDEINGCHGDNYNSETSDLDNNEISLRPNTMTPFALDPPGCASINSYTSTWYFRFEFLIEQGICVDWIQENKKLIDVISMHATILNCVYAFYARLGHEPSDHCDNVFSMDEIRFYRFIKDVNVHLLVTSLVDVAALIANNPRNLCKMSGPNRVISFHEFIENLIIISHYIYREATFAASFTKLLSEKILPHACQLKGNFFNDKEKLRTVLQLFPNIFSIFEQIGGTNNFNWRQLIFLIKDMDLFESIKISALIELIEKENPNIKNSKETNLQILVHWFDFLEVFVGISELTAFYKMITGTITNFDPNQEMEDIPHPMDMKEIDVVTEEKKNDDGVIVVQNACIGSIQRSSSKVLNEGKVDKTPIICYQPTVLKSHSFIPKLDWSKQFNQFILNYSEPIIKQIIVARQQAIYL